ncbi:MAG: hypothetical protein HC877_22150 [Thioploca sp.]|nr:hypothetical protein [Thioploca sp.]
MIETNNLEKELILQSDSIIAHSEPMIEYLSSLFQIPSRKFQSLHIFDYIGIPFAPKSKNNQKISIAFAGYLGISKKKLLDILFSELPENAHLSYNLYGSDFPEELYHRNDIAYNGSITPETLPSILNQNNNFGLLWDEFNPLQKEYYKMIVPHKCSLYIRSLLPLIVPSNTYIGDFVDSNQIGITIDGLCHIERINLSNLHIDYGKLKDLQQKLNSGHFTIDAINRALK